MAVQIERYDQRLGAYATWPENRREKTLSLLSVNCREAAYLNHRVNLTGQNDAPGKLPVRYTLENMNKDRELMNKAIK